MCNENSAVQHHITELPCKFKKESTKGAPPGKVASLAIIAKEQLYWKELGDFGGQQAEHEPGVCPGSKSNLGMC